MMRKILLSIIPVSLIIFTVACQLDVPVREMVDAKKKISRAYEVQADRLDPDTLKKAVDSLVRAHDCLISRDADKAKDEARSAADAAERAIATSLPLLADESLKAAKTQRDKCDPVFAEKFSPEDQSAGSALLKDAEALLEQKEYWQAHLKAREAETVLARAVQSSLAHKAEISERHDKLTGLHAKLANDPYASESKDELAVAAGKVAEAGEALAADRLRDASQLLDDADNALKSAEGRISVRAEQVRAELISKKKDEIKQRIGSLRNELATLSADPGAHYADTDLKAADSLLAEAESGLDADADKSVTKCDQAGEKITSARKAIGAGALLERADALDLERTKLASDPDAAAYQEKLDSSSLLISDSRALAQSGSFNESTAKLNDAEGILALVKTDIERLRAEKAQGTKIAEEKPAEQPAATEKEAEPAKVQERIYVVKYNPKNRDCLWRIAAHEYGNARLWPLIYVANRDTIKDPDLIFPGQKLVIPPLPEKKVKPEPAPAPEKPEKESADTAPAPDSSPAPAVEEAPGK